MSEVANEIQIWKTCHWRVPHLCPLTRLLSESVQQTIQLKLKMTTALI